MAASYTQGPGENAHDPDSRYGADKAVPVAKQDPLQTPAMQDLSRQVDEWWIEARDKHVENRAQRFLDHDYYDHDQISAEDRAVYEERGQAPVVHNLVHPAIDWLTGTERRTRIDWKILPRGPEDDQGAKAQSQLIKYVSDANGAGWQRSRAFKDATISGVGFVEEFLRRDRSQEPVGYAYTDWRYLWWDPFSRDPDFGDARYFHRAKFVDLDDSIAQFHTRAADLKAVSVAAVDNEYMLLDELDGLPAMFAFSHGHYASRGSRSGMALTERHLRRRVRLIETWYQRRVVTPQIHAVIADTMDLHGALYEPNNAELREKLDKGQISLVDSLTTKMAMCIWAPGLGLLHHTESPYSHNKYPFSAVWCFRHHRDGMPYGYVRGMRDPQDEYNKRRAKALFSASVNRVLFEEDAFSEEDEETSLEEIARPNGEVRLAPGGLNKIKIDTGLEVSAAHINFMAEAKEQVFEGSGITRENLAHNTNAISGRAILAKQQQGAVTTAEVFDNYREFQQGSGGKLLEITKRAMSLPRQIRILGQNEGVEWLAINQPIFDPVTGQVTWDNDVLNTLSDFVVGEQDFRETLRMAMAESLFEVIGKLPPELALQMIDLAVELTDIPNKDEFVRRIRAMNGAQPSPQSPEDLEAAERERAAAERAAELEAAERRSKIALNEATAEDRRATAKNKVIDAKGKALATVAQIPGAEPIAQAADELFAGAAATPPQPVQPGVVQ